MMPRDQGPGPVERLVRRDQWIVSGCVAVIFGLALAYTLAGVGMEMSAVDMTRMAGSGGMAMGQRWDLAYAGLIFLMWWVMMIAMMTPSAAPMLLLFAALKRRGAGRERAVGLTLWFLAGYLLVWGGFSLLAAALQWGLGQAGALNAAMMRLEPGLLSGVLLLGAGLYQFSRLKAACLTYCRSPAWFLTTYGRPGVSGALRLGGRHGAYCLGCCWALMALLFVGGIMNLWWIFGLALYVLAEKLLPAARWLTLALGAGLVGGGGYLIAGALI